MGQSVTSVTHTSAHEYLLDSAWKEWYRGMAETKYKNLSGEQFEGYVSQVLQMVYPDFVNPSPSGRHGDGGCDGLAQNGRLFFACYGQSAQSNADKKTRNKMEQDLARGLACWDALETWVFITNGHFGPESTKRYIELAKDHSDGSERSIEIRVCNDANKFWESYVSKLDARQLNTLMPGAPHAQRVDFGLLTELVEKLAASPSDYRDNMAIAPVSKRKMEYNKLPAKTMCELNEGRLLAPRIDDWFSSMANPELRDEAAAAFNGLYRKAESKALEPAGIMERLYISVGGSDFRLDAGRANAVYAIASYFFDACDIFEAVPEGWNP